MDWNNNGHNDSFDDFVDYQVYKDTSLGPNYSGGCFGGILKQIVIVFLILMIFGKIIQSCEAKSINKRNYHSTYSPYSYSSSIYTATTNRKGTIPKFYPFAIAPVPI